MAMPSTADVDVVRRLYQAIADRDFGVAEGCVAADVVWHLPGTSPIAGDHHGWAQIRDNFMAKLGLLSGDTFRAELLDVAVGQRFVITVQHATAAYRGRSLDIVACQLMTIRDGLIREVRGHYSDQAALDDFWG
jgi:uncharacterized protein